SLEGTLAFAVIAVASGLALTVAGVRLAPGLIVAGAMVAAGVELVPLRINDNLVIPVVSGGAMELIARLAG
ncbi:MAG: hypothetical protein H6Q96_740, partial [Nitrospirae bacterium]|nr:hypothetical protein [Nitrospirota bacterium]